MNVSQIAARVKVCTLKTGAWRPTRLHRSETIAENTRHGSGNAARVLVRVCNHPSLSALEKLHREAYDLHQRTTRPTVDDGIRLVPLCKEMEHAAAMGAFKAKHDALVSQFLADYEQEKAAAPVRLNGLFDDSAWPTLASVKERFRFEINYRPCPTEGEWQDWLSVSAHAAEEELREQLITALRRMAERLSSDGKLYQSVFDNLHELCEAIPDLNLRDDPIIMAVAAQAKRLADNDKDTLAPSRRKEIAAEADRLASMFQPPLSQVA